MSTFREDTGNIWGAGNIWGKVWDVDKIITFGMQTEANL
jgi:hypothetical protein